MSTRLFPVLKFLTVFLFLLVSPLGAAAQSAAPSAVAPEPIAVATVNIQDAVLVSQAGSTITVGFDISNRVGIQPDVLYAVSLSQKGTDGRFSLLDMKVYADDVLTLRGGETVHKEITYEASTALSGTYRIWLEARSTGGLLLAFAQVPTDVLLTGSGGAFTDKNDEPVPLSLDPNRALQGSGTMIRNLTVDKDYYARGDTANVTLVWSGVTASSDAFVNPGTFDPAKAIRTATTTSTGAVALTLSDGQGASCAAPYTHTVSGALIGGLVQASIPVTSICKDPIITASVVDATGGSLASRTFSVTSASGGAASASAGMMLIALALIPLLAAMYLGARFLRKKNVVTALLFILVAVGGVLIGGQEAKADVYNYDWRACTSLLTPSPEVAYYDENGPVYLTDEYGNTMYYSTWCLTGPGPQYDPATQTHTELSYLSPFSVTYTISLDKTSYTPGETITAYGYTGIVSPGTEGGHVRVGIGATVNGSTKNICAADATSVCGWTGSGYTSQTFTAPTTPGTYNAIFNAYVGYYQVPNQNMRSIDSTSQASIQYTVVAPPPPTPACSSSTSDQQVFSMNITGGVYAASDIRDFASQMANAMTGAGANSATPSTYAYNSMATTFSYGGVSGETATCPPGGGCGFYQLPATNGAYFTLDGVNIGSNITVKNFSWNEAAIYYGLCKPWDALSVDENLNYTYDCDSLEASDWRDTTKTLALWIPGSLVASNYGTACPLTSGENACGQTAVANTGTYDCSGCVGTPPAPPSNDSCTPPSGTCSVSPATGDTSTPFTWTASGVTGGVSPYAYSWSGTDGLSGSGTSVTKTYSSSGTKTASVTVTDAIGNAQILTCRNSTDDPSITVTDPVPPLSITVSPTSYAVTLPRTSVAVTYTLTNGTSADTNCRLLDYQGSPLSSYAACEGVKSVTAPASVGAYSYTIQANQSSTNQTVTSNPFTVTVSAAPVCTSLPANASAYPAPDNSGLSADTAYTYTYSATDTAAKCQFKCASGYTWTNSSCALLPDLTAGAVTPTTAAKDVAVTLSATISNTGAPTGAGFTNFFQKATNALGANATSIGTASVAALPAPGSAAATLSYTFTSAAAAYVRACADKSAPGNTGVITESREDNNCGPWTRIAVSNPSITASCSVAPSSGVVGDTFTWTVSDVAGGSGSYEYLWLGTDSLSGINVTSVQKSYATAGTKTASVTVTSGGNEQTFACGAGVTVTALPNLTSLVPPTSSGSGYVNEAQALSGVVKNIGAGAAANFPNMFQIKTADLSADVALRDAGTVASLVADAQATVTGSYAFSAVGTYKVRTCANEDTSWGGSIAETNAADNCSDYATITIAYAPCENGATNPPTCSQCPDGQAYVNGVCTSCTNPGGCSGTGGTPTDPLGPPGNPLVCNNGAVNPINCNTFPPACPTLSTTPTDIVTGGTVSLSWVCQNAASCTELANANDFSTGGQLSGTDNSVRPSAESGPVTYGLTCDASTFYFPPVMVHAPASNITASPSRVAPGGATTIAWTLSEVRSCAITRNGSTPAWRSGLTTTSSAPDSNLSSQTTYVLSCTDVLGNALPDKTAVVNVTTSFQEF